jgi:uncharacterized damage-inducible protein DinB
MTERENLQGLLYGDGAHANVLNALEGLDEKLVGARPANSPHSIFQILWHIVYWQDYELESIAGEHPSYPSQAIKSWPQETAPRNLQEWEETIKKFVAGLKRFEAILADPAVDLDRMVNSKKNENVRDLIVMIIVHNSHHFGQLITLRQQLGSWPPPKGGDTW